MRTATEVFVSDLLRPRYASLHAELAHQLARFGIACHEIQGTRDIWCRDYMPVPIDDQRFVQFRYAPDYLTEASELVTPPDVAEPIVGTSKRSKLVVDGGNVMRCGSVAIVTERVFVENVTQSMAVVERELREMLEVDRLVVIPVEPGDLFGHADGVLHLIDERMVLVNDYTQVDPDYGVRLGRVLREHGIETIPIPIAPEVSDAGDVPAATGVYVNLLALSEAVFVPVYGIAADGPAIRSIAEAFRDQSIIVPVDCRAVAREGGSLHCVTWSRPAARRHA